MIIHSNNCLACFNKKLWKQIRRYAAANNLTIEHRRTDRSKEYRAEAEQYGLPLPFFVIDGTPTEVEVINS